MNRRQFLRNTGRLSAGLLTLTAAGPSPSAAGANDRLRVAVMGLGRGMDHLQALLSLKNVEVAYVCDVDDQRLQRGVKLVSEKQTLPVRGIPDFRRILEDRTVDALTIATPNHWHGPATMLACSAGKHVYVEKPGSHNARESEWMVEAAARHRRRVQLGTQRRSWPGVKEMIARLRDGVIGRVLYARCFYANGRTSIGRGRAVPVPANLDFALWQGPAPERPYVDNLVHYHWHWRWHWGGGELANNGVHALDLARWGLGADHPVRVTFNGGRYHFDDDQETPDTGAAVFDFGRQGAMWDNSSCLPRTGEKLPFVAFYGEGGTVVQEGGGYRVFDVNGKETGSGNGPGGDAVHFQNFVDAIRQDVPLNAPIGEGQKSTLLCHLGNIAYRTGHTLRVDPGTGRVPNDPEAGKLWTREYRSGWTPRV